MAHSLVDRINQMNARKAYGMKSYTGGTLMGWMWDGMSRAARNRRLPRDQFGYALAYMLVPDVRSAVDVYAQNMARIPYFIYRNPGHDPADNEIVASSQDVRSRNAIDAAIRQHYHDYHTPFLLTVAYSMILYDEIYIELIRNPSRVPAGYRVLNPLAIEPEIQQGEITGYTYSGDEGYIRFQPRDIAYSHGFNPLNDIRGGSLMQTAIDSVDVLRSLVTYLGDFFDNNARPGMLMTPRGDRAMPEREWQRLTDEVGHFLKGRGNQFNTFSTSIPVDFTAMENPDLQKQFSVHDPLTRQIYRAFRVPLAMVGDSSIVRFKEGQEQQAIFVQQQLVPYLEQIELFMNARPVPFFDTSEHYMFAFDASDFELLTEGDQLQSDVVGANLRNGIIPLTRAQELLGEQPDEDLADIYLINGEPVHKRVLLEWAMQPRQPATNPFGQPALPGQMEPPRETPSRERTPPQIEGEAAAVPARAVFLDADDPMSEDLRKWQTVALRRWKAGDVTKAKTFESNVIPPVLHAAICGALDVAQDTDQIYTIFDDADRWHHHA